MSLDLLQVDLPSLVTGVSFFGMKDCFLKSSGVLYNPQSLNKMPPSPGHLSFVTCHLFYCLLWASTSDCEWLTFSRV